MDGGRVNRINSLGDWLKAVERIGELKRIRAQVDCDLEMSTITYMDGKTVGGPTLLFENIKGHPGRACCLIRSAAALNRVAMSIREKPANDAIGMVRMLSEKMKKKLAPVVIDAADAAVNQNIDRGDQVDVTQVPGAEDVAAATAASISARPTRSSPRIR